MGIDVAQGAALTLAAGTATGSATIDCLAGGTPHVYARVGLRVAAYSGWGGTVVFQELASSDDTIGGKLTSVGVGNLTADGTDGYYDLAEVHGAYQIEVSATGNNKAMSVVACTWGNPTVGAA